MSPVGFSSCHTILYNALPSFSVLRIKVSLLWLRSTEKRMPARNYVHCISGSHWTMACPQKRLNVIIECRGAYLFGEYSGVDCVSHTCTGGQKGNFKSIEIESWRASALAPARLPSLSSVAFAKLHLLAGAVQKKRRLCVGRRYRFTPHALLPNSHINLHDSRRYWCASTK